jgi:hypothetical protein
MSRNLRSLCAIDSLLAQMLLDLFPPWAGRL